MVVPFNNGKRGSNLHCNKSENQENAGDCHRLAMSRPSKANYQEWLHIVKRCILRP